MWLSHQGEEVSRLAIPGFSRTPVRPCELQCDTQIAADVLTECDMRILYQVFRRECLPLQGEGESLIRLDDAGFRHTHE